MPKREQVQKSKQTVVTREPVAQTPEAKQPEKLKSDLDALLDEVDSVLEENAEEFVKGYVQRGGE